MSKYGLHSELLALPGKGKELIAILEQASSLVRKEHKCLVYILSHSMDNEDSIWVTEVWNSKEEHDESLLNTEVRALIKQAVPLLASPPKGGKTLTVVGGI
jgi:quinol monooxygenase YgiN